MKKLYYLIVRITFHYLICHNVCTYWPSDFLVLLTADISLSLPSGICINLHIVLFCYFIP